MAGTIQINEAEYNGKKHMCEGCVSSLLASSNPIPSASSDAVAMQAFMRKMTELGTLISSYKSILQADVAALESVKQSLIEADRAASGKF